MKKSLLVLVFLCFRFSIFAQSGDLAILDVQWTNLIQHSDPTFIKELSSPTAVSQPYIKMTIQGDRELYERWTASKEITMRFVWFAESRVLLKRKSLKVESDFNFKNTESLQPLEMQLDSLDYFSIDIWSRSFRRLREGEVKASLVYKNNKPVRKCEEEECTFNILIEK